MKQDTQLNKVTLVLEPEYGERLAVLASAGHVWVVDTPANHQAAKEYWDQTPNSEAGFTITTFKFSETASRLETFRSILEIVDLHHGGYSSTPYAQLEVIGLPLTAKARSAVKGLGFDHVGATAEGFRATRSPRHTDRLQVKMG